MIFPAKFQNSIFLKLESSEFWSTMHQRNSRIYFLNYVTKLVDEFVYSPVSYLVNLKFSITLKSKAWERDKSLLEKAYWSHFYCFHSIVNKNTNRWNKWNWFQKKSRSSLALKLLYLQVKFLISLLLTWQSNFTKINYLTTSLLWKKLLFNRRSSHCC